MMGGTHLGYKSRFHLVAVLIIRGHAVWFGQAHALIKNAEWNAKVSKRRDYRAFFIPAIQTPLPDDLTWQHYAGTEPPAWAIA